MHNLFVVFFLSALSFSAHAMNLTPQGIYMATKEACVQLPEEVLIGSTTKMDRLRAGYFPSEDYTNLMNAIRRQAAKDAAVNMNFTELGTYAKHVLKSPSFEQALSDCYSQSARAKKFFRDSVLNSDRAGKTAGIAAAVLIFRGVSKGIGIGATFLKRWSTFAYDSIKLANNAFLGLAATSLLTADSTQKEKAEDFQLTLNDEQVYLAQSKISNDKSFNTAMNSLIQFNQAKVAELQGELKAEKRQAKRAELLKKIASTNELIAKMESEID